MNKTYFHADPTKQIFLFCSNYENAAHLIITFYDKIKGYRSIQITYPCNKLFLSLEKDNPEVYEDPTDLHLSITITGNPYFKLKKVSEGLYCSIGPITSTNIQHIDKGTHISTPKDKPLVAYSKIITTERAFFYNDIDTLVYPPFRIIHDRVISTYESNGLYYCVYISNV